MPRISKKFGYVPDLPNQGSRLQTPSTLLIDVHYSKLLLVERWTWERFTRLCAFLQISPAELGCCGEMTNDVIRTPFPDLSQKPCTP